MKDHAPNSGVDPKRSSPTVDPLQELLWLKKTASPEVIPPSRGSPHPKMDRPGRTEAQTHFPTMKGHPPDSEHPMESSEAFTGTPSHLHISHFPGCFFLFVSTGVYPESAPLQTFFILISASESAAQGSCIGLLEL